jgi:hypothetical protein
VHPGSGHGRDSDAGARDGADHDVSSGDGHQ